MPLRASIQRLNKYIYRIPLAPGKLINWSLESQSKSTTAVARDAYDTFRSNHGQVIDARCRERECRVMGLSILNRKLIALENKGT